MRIIAISIVVLAGALLVAIDSLPETRGRADDFGPFTLVVGLIALGVELYLIPFLKWHRDRD